VTALSDVAAAIEATTELELAGYEARHIVRSGLADILEWLGEGVGPVRPPTHRQLLDVLGAPR
jgi:hypothetical protein